MENQCISNQPQNIQPPQNMSQNNGPGAPSGNGNKYWQFSRREEAEAKMRWIGDLQDFSNLLERADALGLTKMTTKRRHRNMH
jgi:hypothetical protein